MLIDQVKNELGNWLVGIDSGVDGEIVIRFNHPAGHRPEWCTVSGDISLVASKEDYQRLGEMFLAAAKRRATNS